MAAVGLAAGNLIIKHLGSKMDALTAVAWQFAFGGAGLLVWSLATESPSVDWSNPRLLTGLVYLALVGSAGASWVWYRLLQNDDLIPLNSLTLLTPSLSVVLAWLLYRETIPLSAWLGIVATLLGVAVVSLPNRRDQSGGSSSMVEDETGRRRYG
jgi:drug/metabolite transporter (DMT)-like permease